MWVGSLGQEESPGVENGNSLQYSCWENPMDRGAWWATVHRVAESQTQLSNQACTDLCCCQWAFSSCGEQGLLFIAVCGIIIGMASPVVGHRLSCPITYGIFPDQGLNPCPLYWQVEFYPLDHQGNPINAVYVQSCKNAVSLRIVFSSSLAIDISSLRCTLSF